MNAVTHGRLACPMLVAAVIAVIAGAPDASAGFDCTVRIGMDSTETLTALRLEVAYAQDFIEIQGSGPAADCSNLSPFAAEFIDDDDGALTAKFSSLDAHDGPMALLECALRATSRPARTYVAVNVVEALDADGVPLGSHPSVSVRDLDCPGMPEATPSTTTTTVGGHQLRETAAKLEPMAGHAIGNLDEPIDSIDPVTGTSPQVGSASGLDAGADLVRARETGTATPGAGAPIDATDVAGGAPASADVPTALDLQATPARPAPAVHGVTSDPRSSRPPE